MREKEDLLSRRGIDNMLQACSAGEPVSDQDSKTLGVFLNSLIRHTVSRNRPTADILHIDHVLHVVLLERWWLDGIVGT